MNNNSLHLALKALYIERISSTSINVHVTSTTTGLDDGQRPLRNCGYRTKKRLTHGELLVLLAATLANLFCDIVVGLAAREMLYDIIKGAVLSYIHKVLMRLLPVIVDKHTLRFLQIFMRVF